MVVATIDSDVKFNQPNGRTLAHSRDSNRDAYRENNSESHYETPDSLRQKIANHVTADQATLERLRQRSVSPNNAKNGEGGTEMASLDKKRQQLRRSPSYTNAISVDSDSNKDEPPCQAELPVNEPAATRCDPEDNEPAAARCGSEGGRKRCSSYSQAIEDSPLIGKPSSEKRGVKTKYFDGKYYVGVSNNTDDSSL